MFDVISSFITSDFGQAVAATVFTGLLAYFIQRRGKLIFSVSNQHLYLMPNLQGGNFPVHTQQLWFQNVGRDTIQGVEIVLNWKPQHYEIWNPREWAEGTTPDGRLVIKIPTLNSDEAFTISMIDTNRDLPVILNVRWAGGVGKAVPMWPQRVWPFRWRALVALLSLIGVALTIYFAIQAIQFFYDIYLRLPPGAVS